MYNYPAYPNLPVDSIAEFLFTSMNIAQTVPFVWEFIDAPAPGSLFFVWMSPQLYANPPTDGYQYLDPERVLHLPVGDKVETVGVSKLTVDGGSLRAEVWIQPSHRNDDRLCSTKVSFSPRRKSTIMANPLSTRSRRR